MILNKKLKIQNKYAKELIQSNYLNYHNLTKFYSKYTQNPNTLKNYKMILNEP